MPCPVLYFFREEYGFLSVSSVYDNSTLTDLAVSFANVHLEIVLDFVDKICYTERNFDCGEVSIHVAEYHVGTARYRGL